MSNTFLIGIFGSAMPSVIPTAVASIDTATARSSISKISISFHLVGKNFSKKENEPYAQVAFVSHKSRRFMSNLEKQSSIM